VRSPLLFLSLALVACPSEEPEPEGCVPSNATAAAECVDAVVFEADLTLLAVERSTGGAGWQAAQDHCRTVLTDLGFEVEDHEYGTGTNVVGTKAGSGTSRGAVVVSAHYDSVDGCVGADDNASGVAGALGVARALASGSWHHDLVVACWDEEERGLVGSRAWADRAAAAGDRIEVAVSLEMIAYSDDAEGSQTFPTGFDAVFPDAVEAVEANGSRGDFIGLVADEAADPFSAAFESFAPASLPTVRIDVATALLNSPAMGDLRRSDHASFWAHGIPAVMVTDTANFRYGGYHCTDFADELSRLDLGFAADVVRATASAAADRLADAG